LSIFWYGKEKENHSNKIIATSQPNSRIKEYEREIEDIPIRNDVLLEIATFLAKRWSNTDDVSIIISKVKKITTNIEKKRIRLFLWQYIPKISSMENITMVRVHEIKIFT
jgi:hypothetical protein